MCALLDIALYKFRFELECAVQYSEILSPASRQYRKLWYVGIIGKSVLLTYACVQNVMRLPEYGYHFYRVSQACDLIVSSIARWVHRRCCITVGLVFQFFGQHLAPVRGSLAVVIGPGVLER